MRSIRRKLDRSEVCGRREIPRPSSRETAPPPHLGERSREKLAITVCVSPSQLALTPAATTPFALDSHRRLPAIRSRGRSPKWGGGAVSRLDGRGISLQPHASISRSLRHTKCIRTTSRTLSLGSHALGGHTWPTLEHAGSDASLSRRTLSDGSMHH
jgi:hypothetical protein